MNLKCVFKTIIYIASGEEQAFMRRGRVLRGWFARHIVCLEVSDGTILKSLITRRFFCNEYARKNSGGRLMKSIVFRRKKCFISLVKVKN